MGCRCGASMCFSYILYTWGPDVRRSWGGGELLYTSRHGSEEGAMLKLGQDANPVRVTQGGSLKLAFSLAKITLASIVQLYIILTVFFRAKEPPL